LHDPATGALQNIVATYQPDAATVTKLLRAGDGTIVYELAVEDSWYSCEASQGYIEAIQPDGSFRSIALGGGAHLSEGGDAVVFARSWGCEPDPQDPTSVVLDVDTVVVRSLDGPDEATWTFPGATYPPQPDHLITSTIWNGPSVLAVSAGVLVTIDPDSPTVPEVSAGIPIGVTSGDPHLVTLVGRRSDGSILATARNGTTGRG
jgi:hypothetical protein